MKLGVSCKSVQRKPYEMRFYPNFRGLFSDMDAAPRKLMRVVKLLLFCPKIEARKTMLFFQV
jgi:hypothetical protein